MLEEKNLFFYSLFNVPIIFNIFTRIFNVIKKLALKQKDKEIIILIKFLKFNININKCKYKELNVTVKTLVLCCKNIN